MSQRSRNKLSKLSKQRSESPHPTLGSSSVDISSAGPPLVLQPTSHPSGPPALSPSTPSPAIAPQYLTPSTSLLPTSAIPPPGPPSLQLSPHSVECGVISSDLTASSPNLTLRPPAPGLIPPSSLLPASYIPTPQLHEPATFAGAHDFVLNNPQFNDIFFGRPGLKELLKYSMPDAFHNSAARYPPPKCHLGTRKDYIVKVTNWVLENSDHHEPILWMRGPFGIGKSAVAQSCAEVLQVQNKLAATLFFSRSNTDRDDARRVFTSIAYQVATICSPFRDIVNMRICDDPALAMKSLSTQFEELLVHPLRQVDIVRSGIEGRVVIIDGLDECRGSSEQCEIIDIIATSARDQTTPFHWFITSRPEDHITRVMKSPAISRVSFHVELPVSRDTDHEILLYLTDEFKNIRESHGLAESWPSEEVFALIVNRTSGLWIYVTTIVRFIKDKNSFGPEDQLRIVLEFVRSVSANVGEDNPLAEMDLFYTLIMRQVPQKIITTVRKILLLRSVIDSAPEFIAAVLDLSEERFQRSCAFIQSVLELRGSDLDYMYFHFYHASFLDFMKDPKRSKELCIYGDFLTEYRRGLLDWLHQVCSRNTGNISTKTVYRFLFSQGAASLLGLSDITFPSEPALPKGLSRNWYYGRRLVSFWELGGVPNHPFDSSVTASLETFQFRMMLRLSDDYDYPITAEKLERFRDNLPTGSYDKIVRKDRCPIVGCGNTENVWILGHGENETVAIPDEDGDLRLRNNQEPRPGQCVCGFENKRDSVSSEST